MFKGDQSQSTKELLDYIKTEAVRGGTNGNLTYLMPAFAALFVKPSDATDFRAKVIMWLTGVLTVLAVFCLRAQARPISEIRHGISPFHCTKVTQICKIL